MRLIQLTSVLLILIGTVSVTKAEPPEYKKFERKSTQQNYFKISLQDDQLSVTVYDDGKETTRHWPLSQIKETNDGVRANGQILFDQEGLNLDGKIYPYTAITEIMTIGSKSGTSVSFLTSGRKPDRTNRARLGHRISFDGKMEVESDEFVRGVVVSIIGDIEVYGEVNRDIVTLFGDVFVGPDAVARGDVVSLLGEVDVSRHASVYGEVYSGKEGSVHKGRHFRRRNHEVSAGFGFAYNRVDGARPSFRIGFKTNDSLLPHVWAQGGYAFASERARFEFGMEQTLLRSRPLKVGGRYFRQLSSGDDWLISDCENTFFALAVTEDFKDYYEAEGGEVSAEFVPLSDLTLTAGYRYEETNWLRAHHNLWSLFGGDKTFADNYYRVDSAYRNSSMDEIDSTVNSAIFARVDWDTRNQDNLFGRSAWHVNGELELSSPDVDSDFDFKRYTLTARRYQRVTRHTMLLVRGIYGGSDGYLPMYKRFYLGGLGTLVGYKHKEFMGSRFLMGSAEYRFELPRRNVAVSALYDVGQIANNAPLDSDAETKHSIGMALYFGSKVRMSIAKRLDRSDDDNPQFYARLEHVF